MQLWTVLQQRACLCCVWSTAGTSSCTKGFKEDLKCAFTFVVTPPYQFVTTAISDDITHLMFYLFALRGQV